MSQNKAYSFNRTVTLGMLITLSIQTASGLIWAGGANARLEAVETQLVLRQPSLERLALLEGQMDMIRQSLTRIERQVTLNAIEAERQK
jgi:hypothetical protein